MSFQQQILTDSPDYTIVKYLIKGEIDKPTLALDISKLICFSPQSAIYQWGAGALPNLPPFITYNKNGSNYIQARKGNKTSNQKVNPTSESNNDLVGFYPPNFPYNQQLPIVSGVHVGSSHISYLITPSNSIDDLIRDFNQIPISFDSYGVISKGNWTEKYPRNYQFNIKTQQFDYIDIDLPISDVLKSIYNYRDYAPTGNYQYSFQPESKYIWKISYHHPKDILLGYLEKNGWTSKDDHLYQRISPKKKIYIPSSWESIRNNIHSFDWKTSNHNATFVSPTTKYSIITKQIASGTLLFGSIESLEKISNDFDQLKIEYTMDEDDSYTRSGIEYDDHFLIISNKSKQSDIQIISTKSIISEIHQDLSFKNKETAIPVINIKIDINKSQLDQYLHTSSWKYIYRDNLDHTIEYYYSEPCHEVMTVFSRNDQQEDGVFISGSLDCIKTLISRVFFPNKILWSHIDETNAENSTIQIVPLDDKTTKLAGNPEIVRAIYKNLIHHEIIDPDYANIKTDELEMLLIKADKESFTTCLDKSWKVYFENIHANYWWATKRLEKEDKIVYEYIQVLFNSHDSYLQLWGTHQAIQEIESKCLQHNVHIQSRSLELPNTIEILELENTTRSTLHSYSKEFQIIGDQHIIKSLATNNVVDIAIQQKYGSLTIAIDTDTFLFLIGQVCYYPNLDSYGIWKSDANHNIFKSSGLYRFYTLEVNSNQNKNDIKPTPYFFEFTSIDHHAVKKNSKHKSKIQIGATEAVLNNIICPFCKKQSWKYIKAGDNPQIHSNTPLIFGKVVGLTGCVSQVGAGDPPLIGIETISTFLNVPTNNNNNSVEFLWEIKPGDIEPTQLQGETVFIASGNTEYGRGGIGTSSESIVANNSGQPLLVNQAAYKTGNVLLKTNGFVSGTIVVTYRKVFGWFNNYSFFDRPTDNLAQAIQAQEFIYRDWIRGVKQAREDNILTPILINAELNNRDPVRPGPWVKPMIVHTVSGTISLFLNTTKYNPREFIAPLVSLFSRGANVPKQTISVSIQNIIEPSKLELSQGDKKVVYTYTFVISMGKGLPMDPISWYRDATRVQKNIESFPDKFKEIQNKLSIFGIVESIEVNTYLSAFAINNLSTVNLDYSTDVAALSWVDRRLIESLFEFENERRNMLLIPSQPRAQSIGALHHVGGINTANESRWLEKQVKRLLIGSEFPIPILLPDQEHPEYRFPNGDPVAGFWTNAFATGVTTAVDPKPPLIVPNNLMTPSQRFSIGNPNIFPRSNFGLTANTQVNTTPNPLYAFSRR